MSEKQKLYLVKIALKGNLCDTVKIQAHNLKSIPKKHIILSYKPIKSNQK